MYFLVIDQKTLDFQNLIFFVGKQSSFQNKLFLLI